MTGHCNCAAMLIDDSSNTVLQMSTFHAMCFNTNECAKLIPLKVYCCVWWNGLSGFADALAARSAVAGYRWGRSLLLLLCCYYYDTLSLCYNVTMLQCHYAAITMLLYYQVCCTCGRSPLLSFIMLFCC